MFTKLLWRVLGERQAARPVTEWVVFAAGLLSSFLLLGYLILSERRMSQKIKNCRKIHYCSKVSGTTGVIVRPIAPDLRRDCLP